ncbi:MAG: polysaccharide biosynthesis C-terminal domain-containing protein, partial [Escherichia coli]|nr:polysaccharide biosynthesis C-terminal domain-containing protein [Escherichia coli]
MIIKLILQFPCIWLLKGMGPLLATALAMVVMNYLILHSFNMEFGLHFEEMAKPTNQILAFSLVMFVVTKLVMFGLGYLVNPHGRYAAFFLLILGVAIGGVIYAYLALKSRLADHLLGARADLLRERLHMN